jgi:S1-C subfamily serine protease
VVIRNQHYDFHDWFLCRLFFAVPSNIARKIIEDLWSLATQRAILGVEGGELNATASKELELTKTEGFTSVVQKLRR